MQPVVAALWGAFFGTVVFVLCGAVFAWRHALRRVALIATVSAVMPAIYATAFLGLFGEAHPRVLAHVAMVNAGVLALAMLALLGFMRRPEMALRLRLGMAALGITVVVLGWAVDGPTSLAMSSLTGLAIGAILFVTCLRSAMLGERLARTSLIGVVSILASLSSISWIAIHYAAPWPVHALAAVSGVVYLATISLALWLRYSYLLELRDVLACGPTYDPVTRMRAHSDTGHMVGLAFFRHNQEGRLVGVIAVSIGNLLPLGQLHGPAAVNHALFVCAGRLRRTLGGGMEVGRLGDDAFLIVVRDVDDMAPLIEFGELLAQRLARAVSLSTSAEPAQLESGSADWVAQVGVGIVISGATDRPSDAIKRARAMSHTAWTQPRRVAWTDDPREARPSDAALASA